MKNLMEENELLDWMERESVGSYGTLFHHWFRNGAVPSVRTEHRCYFPVVLLFYRKRNPCAMCKTVKQETCGMFPIQSSTYIYI